MTRFLFLVFWIGEVFLAGIRDALLLLDLG